MLGVLEVKVEGLLREVLEDTERRSLSLARGRRCFSSYSVIRGMWSGALVATDMSSELSPASLPF